MELVYDYVEYIDSLGNRNKKEIIEINKSFDNNFYKYTDRIICISDYLKNQVKNSNHGKLVFKIPPIIDFSFFDSVKIESRNPSNFLFCGSAAYFDIIVFIINSFFYSEAVKNNYQLKLIINGASSQILRINEFVDKKKNRNNITILSKLSYIDLIRYYKSATALLIPISNNLQDKARFPFKICEYTASKRPIITSDTGAIEEFFKDNKTAFIAKADDYESFADKMNLVINEPGFANEIGANGYNLGKKVFNYKAYAEEFKKFLVKKQL
jgi:glycosyltransferase involved in cell wall biosynthesis